MHLIDLVYRKQRNTNRGFKYNVELLLLHFWSKLGVRLLNCIFACFKASRPCSGDGVKDNQSTNIQNLIEDHAIKLTLKSTNNQLDVSDLN